MNSPSRISSWIHDGGSNPANNFLVVFEHCGDPSRSPSIMDSKRRPNSKPFVPYVRAMSYLKHGFLLEVGCKWISWEMSIPSLYVTGSILLYSPWDVLVTNIIHVPMFHKLIVKAYFFLWPMYCPYNRSIRALLSSLLRWLPLLLFCLPSHDSLPAKIQPKLDFDANNRTDRCTPCQIKFILILSSIMVENNQGISFCPHLMALDWEDPQTFILFDEGEHSSTHQTMRN